MPGRTGKTAASQKRAKLRAELWPKERPWRSVVEQGWFAAPRSLPMILVVLQSKKIKGGKTRLGAVYLELLSRHFDEGIIEMATPEEHAHSAGFTGTKAQRDWRENMKVLEAIGLIRSRARGNMMFGYVLLRHPSIAMDELHRAKKLPKDLYEQYRARQIELKEPHREDLEP